MRQSIPAATGAVSGTIKDSQAPYDGLLRHVREVWGLVDSSVEGNPRVPDDPG